MSGSLSDFFMRRCILSVALLALLLSWASSARADTAGTHTLTLAAGDHLRGECVEVGNGTLSWRTVYGDTIRVPISAVSELTCGEAWDLQFSDGQTMRAHWSVANGILTLQSTVFGMLHCPISQLQSGARAIAARGLEPETSAAAAATPGTSSSPGTAPVPAPAANEAPPSSLQTLLRQSSILLRPKQWSLSSGLQYAHSRLLYAPDDTRQLSLVNQIQYGVTPRVQGSLQWPVFLSGNKRLTPSPDGSGVFTAGTTTLRSGNPELGAALLLFGEGQIRPECVVVTGLTIPVNRAAAGGVFKSRVGLEFLKTSDPGALFAGMGWIHEGDGWQSSPYKPTDRITYHLGAAIGLNDELAIGFQAQGVYSPELRARNGTLLSTQQEPVEGRFWFNFRTTQYSNIEAAVEIPVSSDAHSTSFGLTFIRRY